MRKLAEFVQLNCTSSISIANFRLQARVINSVYKGFDAVNNDEKLSLTLTAEPQFVLAYVIENAASGLTELVR